MVAIYILQFHAKCITEITVEALFMELIPSNIDSISGFTTAVKPLRLEMLQR
jgi:hypothetical protein